MATCAISGEVCSQPVVSKATGVVFEKRVIEKHLLTSSKCPVSGEQMSVDDLIPLRTDGVVRPRPPSATSIPSLLSTFTNEWDALMLETYTLRQDNASLRQELAHALYQLDASKRVIARMMKERDEARRFVLCHPSLIL